MKIKNISIGIISLFIVLMGILLVVLDKKEFSENENRYLAKLPEASLESVFSGDYMEDISKYVADHFPFRDLFMAVKTKYEKDILTKLEINDVYVAKDGFYIEKYESPKNTEKIINVLNRFKESIDIPVSLMLVPTAVTVYEEKLTFAPDLKQESTMNRIYEETDFNDINVFESLMEKKEDKQLFYKLDHHWTTDGAYVAYKSFCEKMGLNAQSENEFNIKKVTEDFKGTIFSKVNDLSLKADSIYIYEQDNKITVDYVDKDTVGTSLYNDEYLDKKDKYSIFLDNIHSLIVITNENAESDKEIAIIKDSYANCFVPFLVKHYKKIHIFDTRHYKEAVSEYINEKGIDEVLILYNMNTIDTDTGITRIY